MAVDVSDSFINQYEREAQQVFQRRGAYLLPTVRTKPGVRGSAVIFQVIGKGTATTKSRHGTITPMNISHTPITITLADFYAGDWVDALDLEKLTIDEKTEIQNAAAGGLGRKIDQQIMVALDATTQTTQTITVTSFAAIRNGLLSGAEALDDNDVPRDGDRWVVMTDRLWAQLMNVDQFIRADYNGPTDLPYINGAATQKRFRSWCGFNIQAHNDIIGRKTATAKNFAYHRNSIGYGYSMLVEGMDGPSAKADVWWDGSRAGWFINHMMSGQAGLIDDTGCIEMDHDDTVALATS